jgi:hypothetical protein
VRYRLRPLLQYARPPARATVGRRSGAPDRRPNHAAAALPLCAPLSAVPDLMCRRAVLRFQRADARAWQGAPARANAARCPGGQGERRVIAMSLYGHSPDAQNFADGVLVNSRVLASVYPGWVLRVYTSSGAEIAAQLRAAGAEVVEMPEPEGIYGMFWRFFAASDPCVSYALFRDTDSLVNPRERAAVDAWLASGKALHSMIDAPEHALWPMQGGMWGIRGGVLHGMEQRAQAWGLWRRKLDDMHFLQQCIWPLFANDHLLHVGNGAVSPWGGMPFPPHPPWIGHVGQSAFMAEALCPTRIKTPDMGALLNASAFLRHNGLVYRRLARAAAAGSLDKSDNTAQARTHLIAAQACSIGAVLLAPEQVQILKSTLHSNSIQ